MSRVLETLATRYRASLAGRTDSATRDLLFPFNELLKTAGCLHGPERHEAVRALEELEAQNVLLLERHRSDRSEILSVRLPLAQAPALFHRLGVASPESQRESLANIFRTAREAAVPPGFQPQWEAFCNELAEAALSGASVRPFDRSKPAQTAQILRALPLLLAWEGESLLRFVSALLFRDSKFLEGVLARVEACLARLKGDPSAALSDFGIIRNEKSFLLHGPVSLRFDAGALQVGLLRNPVRIGATDIRRANLETAANRCLTVENAAMLHELAKLGGGTLLASSGSEGGFANSATIAFLRSLPAHVELWHFGDSDPKGFDILRDLRERSGRGIRSLHMLFRPLDGICPALDAEDLRTIDRLLSSEHMTSAEKAELAGMRTAGHKGAFEQESLGRPAPEWPFY